MINKQDDAAISDVLQDSFLQLDDDISVEALEHSKTLGVALSGNKHIPLFIIKIIKCPEMDFIF